MNTNVDDILHYGEQLKNTLYCDDKEKLRSRLAELQRKYSKTAQRLQRAERSEAVRRHVRSRITQQNQQDPCLRSTDQNTSNAADKDMPQGQAEGHSDAPRRSQVIRFMLPSDAASPQSPDPSHDGGHRPSTALRLRSRRSRLRWQRRSAEASRNAGDAEQSESLESETILTEVSDKPMETDAADESEELFSSTDSETPSLLLTHWNTQGHTDVGDMMGNKLRGQQKQRELETDLEVVGKCCNAALSTKQEKGLNGTENGKQEMERSKVGVSRRVQQEKGECEKNVNENTEQRAADTIQSDKSQAVEINEGKNDNTNDGKATSILDSCTLVEGLLFPLEYYVRTTRRMASSQSQPDMQAVILSQLSTGRRRMSRGRGRGLNRETHTRTNLSSPSTALASPGLLSPSHVPATNVSAECSQTSSKTSDPITACQTDSDACFSPMVATTRPPRGRRKRRGRGRRQTSQPSLNRSSHPLSHELSLENLLPTSTSVSSSQCSHKTEGTNPSPHDAVPEPDGSQSASIVIAATSQTPGTDTAVSERVEKIYPIFLKSSIKRLNAPQANRGTSTRPSLLLPHTSSPAQTSLLPLPSLSSGWLDSNLTKLDIHQDFHLPDDQFASLKLHKLRQVTVDSGLEHFSTPSRNTRSSIRLTELNFTSSDQLTPLHLRLSSTPTLANSPHPSGATLPAAQHSGLQSSSEDRALRDKMENESSAKELSDQHTTGIDVNQQAANLQREPTDCLSVVEECSENCVDKKRADEAVIPRGHIQSRRSINYRDEPQLYQAFTDRARCRVNDCVTGRVGNVESEQPASENQSACKGVVQSLPDPSPAKSQAENRAITETLSFDSSHKETPKEPSNNCTAVQACSHTEAAGESPMNDTNKQFSSEDADECCVSSANLSTEELFEKRTTRPLSPSELLMSSLASAPCLFIAPHLPSSTLSPSPMLPSLGLTPYPAPGAPQPSFAPSLTLPPTHSPSTQSLSPPPLSPCPSITHLPPSLPPLSLPSQIQVSCEPPDTVDQLEEVEPAACPTQCSVQLRSPAGLTGLTGEEEAERQWMRRTHVLKAAAGGSLVDVCLLSRSSGDVCVAAAGKWAVCLWSQISACDWSIIHTWTFSEPVINVFPVPYAAELMCVTLGQLEIREVRMLSCSSLMQMLVCEGVFQVVIGMSESRVVTSSHSASGSTLQVFTLSDSSSSQIPQPLVSPGVCVGSLAAVDGLPDALIGTDECGHLFIWNLKTGQLLCRVLLGPGLSHTACLKGYSYRGMLLVLLQHQFLSSMKEEEKEAKIKTLMFLEEETSLFSFVGINPLNGKSILATQLHPPKAWSGSRLCETDVSQSSIVGLSQSGSLCVWELGKQDTPQMVGAPEGEDWQLVRWGGPDRLVIGHHNGDVSLHYYSLDRL